MAERWSVHKKKKSEFYVGSSVKNFLLPVFSVTQKMASDIDRVLRNLGVLSAVKQNDKLLTEGEYFAIYVPTVMRGLVRMAYGESRETNVKRISDCIAKARDYVTGTLTEHSTDQDVQQGSVQIKLYRHSQVQQCSRVINALSEINTGLDNLVETYREDAGLVVRIRQIKAEVNDFVESTQMVGRSSPVIHRLTN